MYERAIAAGRREVELSLAAPTFVALLGDEYAVAGQLGEAKKILKQLQELFKQRYVTSYAVARKTDEPFRMASKP